MKKEFSGVIKKASLLLFVDIIILGGMCALVSALTLSKVVPQELLENIGSFLPTVAAFLGALIVCKTMHDKKLQIAAIGQGMFLLIEIVLRIVTNTASTPIVLTDVLGIALTTLLAIMISNLSGTKSRRKHYGKLQKKRA